MKLNVQKLYKQILQEIKEGLRPQIPLDKQEALELFVTLGKSLEEKNWDQLKKTLCVLGHALDHREIFEGPLCKLLNRKEVPFSLKIFALTASSKHIIERRNKLSKPLPDYYLKAVSSVLTTKNAELKEWALRTVDEMGQQGKALAPLVLKNRPKFWHMFSLHHRNSHDIIEELIKKWGIGAFVK